MDPNTPESEWFKGSKVSVPSVCCSMSDGRSEVADSFGDFLEMMARLWPASEGVDQFLIHGLKHGSTRFGMNLRRGVSRHTGVACWELTGGTGGGL